MSKQSLQLLPGKPTIGWWKSGDPCLSINVLNTKLESLKLKGPNINIVQTKNLSDRFCELAIKFKNSLYLHINITGMGRTNFEPNIQSVREIFSQITKLLDNGFPKKQIFIIVDPVIPNENGLKGLKLLLKLFTEYKTLRLSYIKFNLLRVSVEQVENSVTNRHKLVFANNNINKRKIITELLQYLKPAEHFMSEYNELLKNYQSIISIDRGAQYLIGIRELSAFGYKNEWFDTVGNRYKLIYYENNNRFKPIVDEILSPKFGKQCINRCVLCPWHD